MKKKLINMITLGCSKNIVDSEYLLKQMEGQFELVHDENQAADIVMINTCGFIGDAKEESVNTILEFAEAKERGEIKQLYVIGCLSERYKESLREEIPEVDQYFGVKNFKEILESLKVDPKKELMGERHLTTPSHFAYFKIAEGCDWKCSYCAIPLIRGKYISKPIEELVIEAKKLVEQGVKELILIAQDLTYYGLDLYKKRRLGDLLRELSDIEGLEWIRLQYGYPLNFPEDVLELMRERKNICNYLDIPFQHVNTEVLSKMRRGVDKAKTEALVQKFREAVPDMALRTTLIVGHPGETEEAFEELKNFVRESRFERMGVFTYSEEEDTFGAENFEDDIPEEVKLSRQEELMQIQEEISLQLNQEKVGREYKVLIDREEVDYYVGRTEYDSPEVDNEILIRCEEELQIGEFYQVKVVEAESFDLYAELI